MEVESTEAAPRERGPIRLDLAVVCAVSFVLATVLAYWVGGVTIYSPSYERVRHLLHLVIWENRVPTGTTWADLLADGLNVRILTVAVAEGIGRLNGGDLEGAYHLIDLFSLWIAFLLLYQLLLRWFPPPMACLGVCLLAACLPLTYLFHYFHPWDRPGLLLWILMAMLVLKRRLVCFGVVLVIAIVNKYDALVAPAMYWVLAARRETMLRTTGVAALLFGLGAGTFLGLQVAFPVSEADRGFATHVQDNLVYFWRNLDRIGEEGILYPPFLVHGLLILLGAIGWRSGCPERRRLWVLGAVVLAPHLLLTRFEEVRAQTPNMILMLPLALTGLSWAFARGTVASGPAPSQPRP